MLERYCQVSVVIPCFNAGSTLEAAFRSAINQSLPPLEVILVDDASSDATWAVMQSLVAPDGIRLVRLRHKKNQGVASARNFGWSYATQPFIAFLDADDFWLNTKLAIQFEWMQQHPEVTLTGHTAVIDDQCIAEQHLAGLGSEAWRHVGQYQQLFKNQFITSSVVIRQKLPWRFHEGKRFSEDYLLWCQVVLSEGKAFVNQKPLVVRKLASNGLSQHLWKMQLGEWESYHLLYLQGLIKSRIHLVFLCVWSAVKGLRRWVCQSLKLPS